MNDAWFFLLAGTIVVSALGVVLSRNLWRAAYCLAATLVLTAVFYLALTAPLLAAVQILLYTGGVLTLVVFALVVTAQSEEPSGWRRPVPAAVLAVLVFVFLASHAGSLGPLTGSASLADGKAAGIELFTRFLVPFELLSVLLLGAIFGALVIARREKPR